MQSPNRYLFVFSIACGTLIMVGCDVRTPETRQRDAEQIRKQIGLSTDASNKSVSEAVATPSLNTSETAELDLKKLTAPAASERTLDSSNDSQGPSSEAKPPVSKPKDLPKLVVDDPTSEWTTPSKLPREIWEVQYVGNTIVGYERRTITAASPKTYKTEIEARTRVSLNGVATDQRLSLTSYEEDNGTIIEMTGSLDIGEKTQAFKAVLNNNNLLELKTTNNGVESISTIEWRDNYRGPFAIEQSLIRKPMKANEIRKLKYFDPILGKVVDCQLESDDFMLTPTFYGGSRDLLPIRNIGTDGDRKRQSLIWVDRKGEGYKSYLEKEDFRSYRTEPVDAKAIEATFDLRDIAVKSTPLDGNIDVMLDRSTLPKRMTYRIRHPSKEKELFSEFSARCSQIVESNPTTLGIEVTTFLLGPSFEKVEKLVAEPMADSRGLQSSKTIPSESKLVLEASKKFSSQFPEGLKPEETMKLFAQTFQKGIALVEFDNQIHELASTIRNKRGDCVEHAILLTSVGRALAIPCRIALGAKFNQDMKEPEMKMHAWVEFHDGRRWLPIDSTDGSFPVPVDRLKVYESYFDSLNPYEELLKLCRLLPDLDIQLVNK